MRRYLARNRDSLEGAVLALVLPFVAGAVNASGFFIVGAYTSHVSGSVARVGDELAQSHVGTALTALLLVAAFFAGAMVAAALVVKAQRMSRARFVAPLVCEAATLAVVTALGIAQPKNFHFLKELTTALLCFSMGTQNALVTRLSGAVVRTTHMTGIVTDLAIESVYISSWLKHVTPGGSVLNRAASLVLNRRHPELKRVRLQLGILSSFLTGAVVGPWLYLNSGYLSMLFPIAILLLLAGFDLVVGFRFRNHAAGRGGASSKPSVPAEVVPERKRLELVPSLPPAGPTAPDGPPDGPKPALSRVVNQDLLNERLRRAIAYIRERCTQDPRAAVASVVQQAAYHFDLNPEEQDFLWRTFVLGPPIPVEESPSRR